MKAPVALGIAAAALLASASPAFAAGDAKGLGEKHQLIFSADRFIPFFSYTRSSISRDDNGVELTNSQTGAGLSLFLGRNVGAESFGVLPLNPHTLPRLGVDFTIIKSLTLGASLGFGFGLGGTNTNEARVGNGKAAQESDAPTITAIGIAPRVGYILGLTDVLALWLRGGIGIYSIGAKTEELENNGTFRTTSISDTLFSIDLDPQLMIVPVEHFFFNVGPIVNIPLGGSRTVETSTGAQSVSVSNDISVFHFGITAGLGGYFDL